MCKVKKYIAKNNLDNEKLNSKNENNIEPSNINLELPVINNNVKIESQNTIINNTTIHITNNNQYNTQNNITNIILNYSDVKPNTDKVMELLEDYQIIEKIIEHTYLNEDNPKNHVLLITDYNRNQMEYYQNGEWHKTLKDLKLNQLIYKTNEDIRECLVSENKNTDIYENKMLNLMFQTKKYMKNVTNNLNDEIHKKKDMILKTKTMNEIHTKKQSLKN